MARLRFICGEMGSGKTAHLINAVLEQRSNSEKQSDIVVFKPEIDTKNGAKLLSRNGTECEVDCLIAKSDDLFKMVSQDYPNVDKIFIDEAQFLSKEQIDQILEVVAALDISVDAYGLRLNFNLGDENFTGATRLLQVAYEIEVIDSKCDICKKEQAIFSCLFNGKKVLTNCPTILISDGQHEVNAKAICAKCYLKYR